MANDSGFMERNYFLLRRLHSLTGILPIGVFLIAHLTTNSSLAWGGLALRGKHSELNTLEGGQAYFYHEVEWINSNVPHLLLIEITLWLSIAFHSVLGVYYARTGKNNTQRYAYQDNKRYRWQRISGYIGVLFIFYHVATLRWQWTFLVPGGAEWNHHFSVSTLAAALRGSYDSITAAGFVVSLFYFVGITLLVFHFANGLWTAAITWGLTVSEQAQKRWGMVCTAIGAGLMLAAWSALGAAVMTDPAEARALEEKLIVEAHGEQHLHEANEKYPGPAPTVGEEDIADR
ncbi:MAG: succinate dehydrogenase cytochrome b558 subunit [Phycisphaerales bacterium]